MFEIKVPELGESVVEAVVGRWLKQVGDSVATGEPLVELETDKVNLEVSADVSGRLEDIRVSEGENVAVGAILASINQDASSKNDLLGPLSSPPNESESPRANPDVRRLAKDIGVDIAMVHGSGPRGRVRREDVVLAQSSPVLDATPAERPVKTIPDHLIPATGDSGRVERVPLTKRRQIIARRLVEAQHTAAMLTTFNDVDMSHILRVRRQKKAMFYERYGMNLGLMSFFIKAVIGGIKMFPRLNAEIDGDDMILKHYYDIGVAVSTDEGLVVPVVREADRLTFAGIERKVSELAQQARGKTLALADLQGGTFTITNGGVFGSMLSTPILNTPQVGILGMHKIEDRPVVRDGVVVVRPMMYLALSYDHRIVDGAEAVQCLVRVKELLEDPERLLIEG